ncbi:MAG: hypothetical protein WB424_00450 [Terracidiphilus sp.]
MAEDAYYQKDAGLLDAEFAICDWDALRLGEDHPASEELSLATAG